jgi:hypothetical protein
MMSSVVSAWRVAGVSARAAVEIANMLAASNIPIIGLITPIPPRFHISCHGVTQASRANKVTSQKGQD